MVTAEDVARYFLWLAQEDTDEPTFLTQMQLHKLVYLAQGWSLGVRKTPLFADRIEAWMHGPVVPSIRPTFADFNSQPIPASEAAECDALTPAERHHVHATWDMYGKYSAAYLRELTHKQRPWSDARRDVPQDARSNATISHESMASFFDSEYDRYLRLRGIDRASLEESSRQVRAGRVFTLDLKTGVISE